jgi:dihydroorotate dehydrogenase electron transfer subunit
MLTVKLVEVIQLGTEIAGLVNLPENHRPQPGQFLPCQPIQGNLEGLTTPLFPVLGDENTLGPLPETWQPGNVLAYLPPQGRGFHLPGSARRVGLVPFMVSPARLLNLASACLNQGAAVALFSAAALPAELLSRVPSQIEILSLADLMDNLDWPDYLAMDVDGSALDRFVNHLDGHRWQCEGEVLIHTPMPCRGLADCGVCAFKAQHGWRFVCTDGPVFPIEEVLHVAQ